MLRVPASKPRSVWRTLVLFFAALLTLGVLAPVTASGHGYPALRVSDTTVDEGDDGYTFAHVRISLKHKVGHKVSVGYYTKSIYGSIAATPGTDYQPAWDRAVIRKWHKSTWVHVKVYGDKDIEPNELFLVKLFKPRGAPIADDVGKVWIKNDDHAPLVVDMGSLSGDTGGDVLEKAGFIYLGDEDLFRFTLREDAPEGNVLKARITLTPGTGAGDLDIAVTPSTFVLPTSTADVVSVLVPETSADDDTVFTVRVFGKTGQTGHYTLKVQGNIN